MHRFYIFTHTHRVISFERERTKIDCRFHIGWRNNFTRSTTRARVARNAISPASFRFIFQNIKKERKNHWIYTRPSQLLHCIFQTSSRNRSSLLVVPISLKRKKEITIPGNVPPPNKRNYRSNASLRYARIT